ncbi:unnamed protein product [Gongylonema pulchrum]|uniref:FERM domain-containing protein n=1 Tax=Gongylonema pulchrum TaxID=637853 RepID=A0A183E0B1_9BILA|nr:unnamed protein product [Gongylonema pulchrum]
MQHTSGGREIIHVVTMVVTVENGKCNFLYKLTDGYIDCGLATDVASKMGVSDEIVGRANEICDCLKRGVPIDPAADDEDLKIFCTFAPNFQWLVNVDFDAELDCSLFLLLFFF